MTSTPEELQSIEAKSTARLRALLEADDPLNWVIAGDSIAQGARWTAGQRDYTQLLEERVRFELDRSSDIFSRTAASGWRIEDVSKDLDRVQQQSPSIVSLGVGINDANLGPTHHDAFRRSYQRVLDKLLSRNAVVIVNLPNTVRQSANATLRDSLPHYAQSIRDMGQRSGALVVDHFTLWSGVGTRTSDAWMADDLHPGAKGHRVLARTLFERISLWDETSECCQLTEMTSPSGELA